MFEDFRKQIDDSAFNDANHIEEASAKIPLDEPRKLLGLA